MKKNELGDIIMQRRVDLKMTRVQLADLCYISEQMIYKIENAQRMPSVANLKHLFNALDLNHIFDKYRWELETRYDY